MEIKPYYKEDGITIYNRDCVEIMPTFGDKSFNLMITDPPYNISAKNNFHTMGRAGVDFGDWDKGFDQKTWLYQLSRIFNKNATIVIFNTFSNLTKTQELLETQGFIYKDFLVIRKSNPMPRNRDRRYINSCEYAIIMVVKGATWVFNRQNETYDSNVLETKVVAGKEKTSHTTQKPLNIITQLIKRHSNPFDSILDPFMGSGTTLVAAKELSRKAIGIEISEKYCEIAVERLKRT